MSNHEAVEPMLGYLYQIRYALFLLLDSDDERSNISIEKFDDVSFTEGYNTKDRIQLKHHIKSKGSLSNASSDMWRTIKVWADLISKDRDILDSTKFIIITTSNATEKSAAGYLKPMNRNTDKAYKILKNITKTSESESNSKYYKAFNDLGEHISRKLINNIYIIDNACNIIDVKEKILKYIKFASRPEHEDAIFERLEGWWYKNSIEYLVSDNPTFINQRQIRTFISDIRDEYSKENLPIDIDEEFNIEEIFSKYENRIFCEQLKLINIGSGRLKKAISDYYKSYTQRSKWAKDGLIYVNEVEKYEERLIDEWERLYLEMEEELEYLDDSIKDKWKINYGRDLYKKISDKNINIRKECIEPFIMRGSYHDLANRMEIGWHIEFREKLNNLFNIQRGDINEKVEK